MCAHVFNNLSNLHLHSYFVLTLFCSCMFVFYLHISIYIYIYRYTDIYIYTHTEYLLLYASEWRQPRVAHPLSGLIARRLVTIIQAWILLLDQRVQRALIQLLTHPISLGQTDHPEPSSICLGRKIHRWGSYIRAKKGKR